jgi:hypothetical protein
MTESNTMSERKTRREYLDSLSGSLSRTRPWATAGVSRATWYRRLTQPFDNIKTLETGSEDVPELIARSYVDESTGQRVVIDVTPTTLH